MENKIRSRPPTLFLTIRARKGAEFDIWNWAFLRIPFILVCFLVVWIFTSSQIEGNIDINELKNTILINRALYSPTSFSYVEPSTGRAYPGIIDASKFNDDTLNKSFEMGADMIAARFELKYIDSGRSKTAYINKIWFDRWEPLSKFRQYSSETRWRYVLAREGDKTEKAVLRSDVVSANE